MSTYATHMPTSALVPTCVRLRLDAAFAGIPAAFWAAAKHNDVTGSPPRGAPV